MIGYILLPLGMLLRYVLVTLCIQTGLFLSQEKVSFGKLFKVVMVAEFPLVLLVVFKILWFSVIEPDFSLDTWQYFPKLNLLFFFPSETIESWLIYPLQTIGLLEVTYWLMLSVGLSWAWNKGFMQSLGMVAQSYGVGLLFWIVAVMFFLVTIS